MDKQNRKMLKIAVLVYLASFFIINWSDVSWIFNYREVSGLVSDFFDPYPSIDARTIDSYFYVNNSSVAKQEIKTALTTFTDKQNTLEIPKISISVPIIFATSSDKASLAKDLDKGATYYPGSVYPGQAGQIVILGHSAPPGWPKIKHDWVFTDIEKLSAGDSIYIDVDNKQFTYTVTKKTIIKRGEDLPVASLTGTNNVLTLISCWPPGKDYQRITVEAQLQS